METFHFGILLIMCIGCIRSENFVSERRFNELEEIIRVKFEELKIENHELKEKLLALETKLEFYESLKEESPLNKGNGEVEAGIIVNAKVKDAQNRISRHNDYRTVPGKLKRQDSENVAFYAYISGKRCYGNHESLIYDIEETNIGNGYSSRDGIFDAPVTGVYVFTITLVPDYRQYVQAEIIVNGAIKGNIFADSDEIHDIHPASTSIVVHLNVGDHVYVRRGTNSDCDVVSDTAHARSTFAGWLLF